MFATLFCIILTNTKITPTINYFDIQTFQHSNHLPTNHHPQNTTIPLSPIVYTIYHSTTPQAHLPPFVLHLTNCTRPPLNRLKSTHTSPQAYIAILILSMHYYIYTYYTISMYTYTYYLYIYICIIKLFLYIIWYKFQ